MKLKLVPIKKIVTKEYSGVVHDLTVKDDHSYNVFNILVHNSICATRLNTGFGVPLLTSIEMCATKKNTAILIADGGIKYNGDIPKLISVGADMVMSGRMWASTSLSPGDCYDERKNFLCKYNEMTEEMERRTRYKRYRGMASNDSRRDGGKKDSSIEGVSGLIPYTGSTEEFVRNLKENLRAALAYGGALDWSIFRRNVKKILISEASVAEAATYVS